MRGPSGSRRHVRVHLHAPAWNFSGGTTAAGASRAPAPPSTARCRTDASYGLTSPGRRTYAGMSDGVVAGATPSSDLPPDVRTCGRRDVGRTPRSPSSRRRAPYNAEPRARADERLELHALAWTFRVSAPRAGASPRTCVELQRRDHRGGCITGAGLPQRPRAAGLARRTADRPADPATLSATCPGRWCPRVGAPPRPGGRPRRPPRRGRRTRRAPTRPRSGRAARSARPSRRRGARHRRP